MYRITFQSNQEMTDLWIREIVIDNPILFLMNLGYKRIDKSKPEWFLKEEDTILNRAHVELTDY